MKIEIMKPVYLENYDINVKRYLDYAEIQNVANEAIKYQTWSERKQLIDYMVLLYATDIDKKKIDDLGHEVFIQSGAMDEINSLIINYTKIEEAIRFEESWIRQIEKLRKEIPNLTKESVAKALERKL